MREGDEAYTFSFERSGIVFRVSIEQLPLVVALDDSLVRGPEVAARVFS